MRDDDCAAAHAGDDAASYSLFVVARGVEATNAPSDEEQSALGERGMHERVLHSDRRSEPRRRWNRGRAAVDLSADGPRP